MLSKNLKKFTLTVETKDEAAEIFILDSQFDRVAFGIGPLTVYNLKKGLYTVKIRAGSDCQEKSIALFKDENIKFAPIQFSTAAPMEGTGKIHEFHIKNALDHSKVIHEIRGTGSEVYIFARDWTSKSPPTNNQDLNIIHPAKGLTLRNKEGKVLVDYERLSSYGEEWDPWAACNIAVNPGTYTLSLRTAKGDILEQTIIASPGWQTQIFLLLQNYGSGVMDKRVNLGSASIFMTRIGEGFNPSISVQDNPGTPNIRIAELARQALNNGRLRLTKNIVRQALSEKFENPMLGLYGANLLLRNKDFDKGVLLEIIDNLRRLLKEPHPDVEALAIKANITSDHIFDYPPMLRCSWGYILEATVKKPDFIPENSFASEIAGTTWGQGVWLIWLHSNTYKKTKKNLFKNIEKFIQLENVGVDISNLAPDQLMSLNKDVNFDSANSDILSLPQQSFEEKQKHTQTSQNKMDDEKVAYMVQSLGIPRAKLDSIIKNIESNNQK